MVRDTFQAVSQSQRYRQGSSGWYEYLRAAIVSGFEAFGSAHAGVCPTRLRNENSESDFEVAKRSDVLECNRPAAEARVAHSLRVRAFPNKRAENPVWEG